MFSFFLRLHLLHRYQYLTDTSSLKAVTNETLRIHSTSSLGLPRLVPAEEKGNGVEVCGRYFPPGTALSVPAYTMHHSKEIWGDDADEFVPERWEEKNLTTLQKNSFIPFSQGPRACVGRECLILYLFLRYIEMVLK